MYDENQDKSSENKPYFCLECKRTHTKGKIYKDHLKYAQFEKSGEEINKDVYSASEKEFKVNKYITLKLEGRKTNIYVKGQLFNQCRFLMLNIQVDKISSFDEIESIDEAAEKLDRSLEGSSHKIDPQTEFWGHCSNLQVWFENKYDTRLLHRNLAFPLLKKLSEVGDPNARRIFKEEICKRFESGNSVVLQYLLKENYLKFLNNEEKMPIITDIWNTISKIDDYYIKRIAFSDLISAIKGTKTLEENFTDILNTIDKIDDNYNKKDAFSDLISAIKGTKTLEENFTDILNTIDKIDDEYNKIRVFSNLISAIKGTKSLEEKFTDILNTIDKINDKYKKVAAFSDLISVIKGTEVFENNYSTIEEFGHNILKKEKSRDKFENLFQGEKFKYLIYSISGTRLMRDFLVDLLQYLKDMIRPVDKICSFSHFIKYIEPDLFKLNLSLIERTLKHFFDERAEISKYYVICVLNLIKTIEKIDFKNNLQSIVNEKVLSLLPFIEGIRKCPSCKVELELMTGKCPQCKKLIDYKREDEGIEFQFLKKSIEIGDKDSTLLLKNKIKKDLEIYENYLDRWLTEHKKDRTERADLSYEYYLLNDFDSDRIVDSIHYLTHHQFKKYFSDEEIDELFANNNKCVKLAMLVFRDFFENLKKGGFEFFPWKQEKFKNIKYLKSLIQNAFRYAIGVGESLEFNELKKYDITYYDLTKYESGNNIIDFIYYLEGQKTIKILKEVILEDALEVNEDGRLIDYFVGNFLTFLEDDAINQIIENLDRKLLIDAINELFSIYWEFNQDPDAPPYIDLFNDNFFDYLDRDGEPIYPIENIEKAIYRLLVNAQINLFDCSPINCEVYSILRKEFPKEFREELYRLLLNCSSIRNIRLSYKYSKYNIDYNQDVIKPLFTFSVIKDFFYNYVPDLITLLISKFKLAKEYGPSMHWIIYFFFRRMAYIKYEDFVKKLIEILKNGNKEDLDCIIKLKWLLYFTNDDFEFVIKNPKIKFKKNFFEILCNRIDDLSYYIDFINRFIKSMGEKHFVDIFNNLNKKIQESFREELIIKLNTDETHWWRNAPTTTCKRIRTRKWLAKYHYFFYINLYKLITHPSEVEKYKFKNRGFRFGYGYKNEILSFHSSCVPHPKLKDIDNIVGLEKLRSLKSLDLSSGNDITEIKNIEHLKELELLDLSWNLITKIPDSIDSLTHLVYLGLRHNNIKIIPEIIGNLHSLKYLDLSRNNIKIIPEIIGNLHSLKYLDLSYNNIETIPETIGNLHSLEYLGLGSNYLSRIPDSIIHLDSLKFLNFKGNSFSREALLLEPIKLLKQKGVSIYFYKSDSFMVGPVIEIKKKLKLKITKWNL